MISHLWRRTALLAACLAAGVPALADDSPPVDAVPIMRPGSLPPRDQAMPGAPLAAPDAASTTEPLSPATVGEPKFGAVPLGPPEAALERIAFEPDEVTLSAPVEARLKEFSDRFKAEAGRVALKAYAGDIGDAGMNARRTALKRALAVREFLLAQGIEAERIDVQALGGVRDAGPHDRVDIIQQGRQSLRKKARTAN
jgi:outer membrane protein OmpA-like peptidoglycan-associated protein